MNVDRVRRLATHLVWYKESGHLPHSVSLTDAQDLPGWIISKRRSRGLYHVYLQDVTYLDISRDEFLQLLLDRWLTEALYYLGEV